MKKIISGIGGVVLLLTLVSVGSSSAYADTYDLNASFSNGVTLNGIVDFTGNSVDYTLGLSNSTNTVQCSDNCTLFGLFAQSFTSSSGGTEYLLGYLSLNNPLLYLNGWLANSVTWTPSSTSSVAVPEGPVVWQLLLMMLLLIASCYRPFWKRGPARGLA
jgi:hypothetical protein